MFPPRSGPPAARFSGGRSGYSLRSGTGNIWSRRRASKAVKTDSFRNYLKQTVDGEDIFPRPPEWGQSAIYYETNEEGFVIRQIQLFEAGQVLAYDSSHYFDDFGRLEGSDIWAAQPQTVSITEKEFCRVWMRHAEALNRKKSG